MTDIQNSGATPDESSARSRRRWLTGSVAVAAVAAGGGVAWWRGQPQTLASGVEQEWWAQTFVSPQGESLAVSAFKGRPLLVNFWATWCPPCVKELPMLSAFANQQGAQGIQVLGLAIDKPEAVLRFLQRQPVQFPVAIAMQGGLGLTRALGNLQGGLPFTVLFDAKGQIRQRKIGELSGEDLANWSQ